MSSVLVHRPPEDGVTEIRVHGVGGTTPDALLGQTGVVQVSGDRTAGFYKGVSPESPWSVEAYSWGGLTAHSPTRAFWVLLLPFALVNLAGWMIEPRRAAPRGDEPPTIGTRIHETLIHLAAVLLTGMYVMWAALISMDIVAFQCGAIPECREGRWYLAFLGDAYFLHHPGRRVVLAALVPVGLLGVFWFLGWISRERYDTYGEEPPEPGQPSGYRTSLATVQFWNISWWHRQVTRLHVAIVLLVLGGVLGRATNEFHRAFDGSGMLRLGSTVFVVALVAAAVALAVLLVSAWSWRDLQREPMGTRSVMLNRLTWILFAVSALVMVSAAVAAWQMLIDDAELVRTEADLVEPVTGLWGFGWVPLQLLAAAIFTVVLFSFVQIVRWGVRGEIRLHQFVVVNLLALTVLWPVAVWVAAIELAAAAVLWVVGRSSRSARTEQREPAPVEGVRAFLAVTVLAVVARLLTGDAAEPWGVDWPRLTPILLFAAALTVMNLWPDRRVEGVHPVDRWLPLLADVAVALAAFAVWLVTERIEWVWALAGLALVVQVVLLLAARPYLGFRWNGPGAVGLLAVALVMGLFAGGIMRLVDLLDRDGTVFRLRSTAIYEWLTIAFGAFLVASVAGVAVWFVRARLRDGAATARSTREWLAAAPDPQLDEVAQRKLATSVGTWSSISSVARAGDVFATTFGMLILAGMAALVLVLGEQPGFDQIATWVDAGAPADWAVVVDWASWLVVSSWIGAYVLIRSGLRDPGLRRRAGVLWDVASFWPRAFHPFAPPAYATRAVQELQRRIEETTTDGRAGTILSGHSQGSVISFAAAASLRRELRNRVILVTHGSPLLRFYRRYFPQYFTDELMETTAASLGPQRGPGNSGAWLNFWRATDPIADPIFADRTEKDPWAYREGVTFPPCELPEPLVTALAASISGYAVLPDVLLRDPPRNSAVAAEPPPTVRGHSGYMADRVMRSALAVQAELLSSTAGSPSTAPPSPPPAPGTGHLGDAVGTVGPNV